MATKSSVRNNIEWKSSASGLYEDGIAPNGCVMFSLFHPRPGTGGYVQLKVLSFFNRSLYFTSIEAAKKEANEMLHGRGVVKL